MMQWAVDPFTGNHFLTKILSPSPQMLAEVESYNTIITLTLIRASTSLTLDHGCSLLTCHRQTRTTLLRYKIVTFIFKLFIVIHLTSCQPVSTSRGKMLRGEMSPSRLQRTSKFHAETQITLLLPHHVQQYCIVVLYSSIVQYYSISIIVLYSIIVQ